jgi:hypothetical protein
MFGRRINWARRPLTRELLGVAAEKLHIKNPDKWQTSWGEIYRPHETRALRAKLMRQVRDISNYGYLACYVNDNGLNAFVEYNRVLPALLQTWDIALTAENYIPFHFAPSLLISEGWQDFIKNRKLLVVTGLTEEKETAIRATLIAYGAKSVCMLPISSSSSLTDTIDLSGVDHDVDIALVAAGIGSANILGQLKPLNTLCIDIGGLMNCFVDHEMRQHGGVIGLPRL